MSSVNVYPYKSLPELYKKENKNITMITGGYRNKVTLEHYVNLLKEKQELINYLKEKIKEREHDIELIGKDVYTSKYAYEEILSKLVEIDQIEKSDK